MNEKSEARQIIRNIQVAYEQMTTFLNNYYVTHPHLLPNRPAEMSINERFRALKQLERELI